MHAEIVHGAVQPCIRQAIRVGQQRRAASCWCYAVYYALVVVVVDNARLTGKGSSLSSVWAMETSLIPNVFA